MIIYRSLIDNTKWKSTLESELRVKKWGLGKNTVSKARKFNFGKNNSYDKIP